MNNAGCNPVYITSLSSTTTEWLNIHESNNLSVKNSTTDVVDKTAFYLSTGLYPALFKFKHSVLFTVQFKFSIIYVINMSQNNMFYLTININASIII